MISAEEIGYESEIQENISIEDIRKEYTDGIIIWLNGSGTSPERKSGFYRCVLDYRGHMKRNKKKGRNIRKNIEGIERTLNSVGKSAFVKYYYLESC